MLAIGRGPRDFRYGSLGDGQPQRLRRIVLKQHLGFPVGEAVRAHHLRKAGHSCARRQAHSSSSRRSALPGRTPVPPSIAGCCLPSRPGSPIAGLLVEQCGELLRRQDCGPSQAMSCGVMVRLTCRE